MSDVLLVTETAPSTPSSGQVIVYTDTTTKRLSTKDDAGVVTNYPMRVCNAVAGTATGFASDTYLSGSSCTIPVAGDWTVGESYYLCFEMTKTAAGTAAFTLTVRMGTAAAIGDASVLALAFGAGTAAVDTGVFEVWVTFTSVGSGTSAIINGRTRCTHHLAATGLVSTGASGIGIVLGTSAGFNSTTQTAIGVSVNGGASFAGTLTLVESRLVKKS